MAATLSTETLPRKDLRAADSVPEYPAGPADETRLAPGAGRLKASELAAFVTSRALITVRKDPRFEIDGVVARWDGSADLAAQGVGFLLWGYQRPVPARAARDGRRRGRHRRV